ncbi:SRPBCC family protein [Brevundimonas goettingensis]|uniref:SRPBCC family protein n=1 Tax=Brevundimonas goettingensis TaxID=2774190 RepID=A0A975BYV3_9CAUL|nr:SRPBCC family protein [Brevundimonas goettingensis]QTC90268.1 SRPBCC family protein [Brevundimonas goettingensis]
MPETDPISTDAEVASPAFIDKDLVEGEHSAASIRAALINRPRQDLYDYWSDITNLPSFMENVKAVDILETGRSQWTIVGPGGMDIQLVSEITEDVPGQRIAWTSSEGSDVDHEGWIEFKDNAFGRGTEVRLFISYDPPAGAVGKVVAKVLQREPRIQARRELRRFKQLMETGEISTSKAPDAAPRGDRHF